MDYSTTVEAISPSIGKIFGFNAQNIISGTGSGFMFLKNGIMVTCDHVVEGTQSLLVKFPDDEKFYVAKIVLRDSEHDLALLKIEGVNKPILQKLSEEKIKEGMPVIFSGFPLTLDSLTTHQGIISAISKDALGITTYLIDGTVNSGNSGCPLMNTEGKVIGVVNAKRRERSDLLNKVEKMALGAVSLHGIDMVEIYQAIITNVQLGIGYAVPASYIPEHKEFPEQNLNKQNQKGDEKEKVVKKKAK